MTDEVSFEDARRELEQIVAKLESGDQLYRACVGKLDAAQGKIEELGKRVEEGRP
jgi:exonuclease VII small subunit